MRTSCANAPAGASAARRIALLAAIFLFAGLVHAAPRAQTPNWDALGAAVVDLEIYRPESETPAQGVGFVVAGVPGIVTSYRLVHGAERILARHADGAPIEIQRHLAADAAADLIVLEAEQRVAGLETSTGRLFAMGQYAFVLFPPSSETRLHSVQTFSQFLAAGLERAYALAPGAPTGAPLADSLGRVVGMIEALEQGGARTSCVVPIERLEGMLAQSAAGGALLDLAAVPAAAWTRPEAPAGAQVIGAIYCRGRRFADGVPLLRRALEAEPTMAAALLELGMCYQMQGQHEQAEELYRQALAAHPAHPLGHLYLGSCLHMQGLYLQAQQTYERGLALHPEWSRLHVNLGGIYFLQNKRSPAEESFREALRLEPRLGVARYNLGVLLATGGRVAEAREQLDYLRAHKSGYTGQLGRFAGSRTPAAEK
ncbi:MAG: tetratricopeptide repeat protein [Candidatus Eisenbacteria sp.]|nr:tetratricopeptide repeat protein [Candidatus Eisenbacteria bacterium]